MIWHSMLVAVGGFFGAIARFRSSAFSVRRFGTVFPYGTLFVNLLGSFLLGLIAGSGQAHTWVGYFFGVGFMGAFTTFSTFKNESLQMVKTRSWRLLTLYLILSYGIGIGLAFAGYWLGEPR